MSTLLFVLAVVVYMGLVVYVDSTKWLVRSSVLVVLVLLVCCKDAIAVVLS